MKPRLLALLLKACLCPSCSCRQCWPRAGLAHRQRGPQPRPRFLPLVLPLLGAPWSPCPAGPEEIKVAPLQREKAPFQRHRATLVSVPLLAGCRGSSLVRSLALRQRRLACSGSLCLKWQVEPLTFLALDLMYGSLHLAPLFCVWVSITGCL